MTNNTAPTQTSFDNLGNPPHRKYRVRRKSANAVKFNPLVGKAFSVSEIKELLQWVRSAGFDACTYDNGVLVIGKGVEFIADGAAFNKHEKSIENKIKAETKESNQEAEELAEYQSLMSSVWIDTQMGVEFTELYTRLKLARYLDGKDSEFTGMVSHKWLEPVRSVGIEVVTGQSKSEILSILKSKYQNSKVE